MQRVDGPTAAAALPVPLPVSGTPGYFAHGNLPAGTPYTTPPPDWFNGIQEELIAVIVAGGLTPDKANNAQLLAAIQAIAAAQFGSAGVTADVEAGEFRFYGGGLAKVGIKTGPFGEGEVSAVFRTPFPTACLGVQLTEVNTGGGIHADFSMQIVSVSKTGFTAMVQLDGADGTTIDGFHWDAKGY